MISEVKDEKSREYILHKLPYEIEVKNHETFLEKADIAWVHNFAKDTGDFQTLSKVDMMVIAAGLKIARQKGEVDKVRKHPKGLDEFRPEKLKEAYDAFSSSDEEPSSDEDQKSDENDEADDWNDVSLTRQEKRTQARLVKKQEWYEKKMAEKAERLARLGA